jgi:cysteinyl-tRNA synthetase
MTISGKEVFILSSGLMSCCKEVDEEVKKMVFRKILLIILIFIFQPFLYSTISPPFSKQRSWLYQLQDPNIDQVIKSGFKIIVKDYTKDGSVPYSKNEVKQLTDKGIIALSYISVGEASFFRKYWEKEWADYKFESGRISAIKAVKKNAPQWLGEIPNPDWPESVKVRFWMDAWFETAVKPALDQILEAGFTGIYMDIIDAYYYWGKKESYGTGKETLLEDDPKNKRESAVRMIAFVGKIARYCRDKKPGFMIFPQNGQEILEFDTDGKYLKTVTGIGAESIWYTGTKKNPSEKIKWELSFLRRYIKSNKIVLSVDYVDDGTGYRGKNKARIDDYIKQCKQEGFLYFVADSERELNCLHVIQGIQP